VRTRPCPCPRLRAHVCEIQAARYLERHAHASSGAATGTLHRVALTWKGCSMISRYDPASAAPSPSSRLSRVQLPASLSAPRARDAGADVQGAAPGSVSLLHACAHTPTGVDPTPAQWERIQEVCEVCSHPVHPRSQGMCKMRAASCNRPQPVQTGCIRTMVHEHLRSSACSFA
jgi:hypothetical protein